MKSHTISGKIVLAGLLTIVLCFATGRMALAWINDTINNDDYCNICHTGGFGTDGTLKAQYQGSGGCVNCHSHATSSTTYTLSGGGETVTVPVVNYTGGSLANDAPVLAGGNFFWVQTEDSKGHNIFPSNPEDDLVNGAPGDTGPALGCSYPGSCHYKFDVTIELSMPGLQGRRACLNCHMVEDLSGPEWEGDGSWRSHHRNDSNLVVGTDLDDDDGYFRFLKGHQSGQARGVAGIEDDDWQASSSPTDHNEYLGAPGDKDAPAGIGSFGDNALGHTVTGFCLGCHGNFHISSDSPGGGDWIRHPAGAVLPDSGEFASYATYNPLAPVARPDFTGWTEPSSTVTPGVDLANCLSCHRAHGSPNAKMLRWDPTAADACVTCHTRKPADTEGQYHVSGVADCNVCHTFHGDGPPDFGPNDNVSLVAEVITTPSSGDKDVTFPSVGASDFVSGSPDYDGICEVCHTATDYYLNNGLGAEHPLYTAGVPVDPAWDCTSCHSHSNEFYRAANQIHATHFAPPPGPGFSLNEAGCNNCHADGRAQCGEDGPYFKSGTDENGDARYNFKETDVCGSCHPV